MHAVRVRASLTKVIRNRLLMDIDIILEPDVTPQQMAELAVEAERLGIRAIWSSNYHMHYDAFLALAAAA
jgi:alkanesulfonate monooxygenase SsuD/methylene tetrahydromethanopterin reductase-like flavin-dependent oxidoreductase (luciferase family)